MYEVFPRQDPARARQTLELFIKSRLEDQFYGREISPWDHRKLIQLVDAGVLGMDGFKYCMPEVAKENWRRCHR